MLNVGVVGMGNCGSQIAVLAHNEAQCDAFAINTCEDDLSTLGEGILKKCIGNARGTGKVRDTAKSFLKNDIMELMGDQDFVNFMRGKDVILVVSSMGGGSGSGMAPLMSNIIRESFHTKDGSPVITILVGVLPRLNEGYSTQVNSLEYLHELFDVLEDPTYMIYDNNNVKATSYKVLETVNKQVVEDIKVIQCRYNVATPYDSIDGEDMKSILSDPGRIVISSLLNIKEKDLDETSIEDLMIDNLKKTIHAELQRDSVVSKTGVITNLSEKLNATFDSNITKVREFVGEPTEEFLHISVNEDKALPNNVCLILSGLSKITDRVDKIRERVEVIEEKQNMHAEDVEDTTITSDEISKMNESRAKRQTNQGSNAVDLESMFSKFGV